MKKIILSAISYLCFLAIYGQSLEQSVLIDFGPSVGTNGAITPSPDTNSNYWNNAVSGTAASVVNLVNTANLATAFTMEVTDAFVVNTSINYGPTAANATTLGDMAISTATMDYFYLETAGSGNNTGQLTFSNLDDAKSYKFYVFGSRPTTSARVSAYAFTGQTAYSTTLQTSDGSTGNLANYAETTYLSPVNGTITMDVSIVSGGYAYVNLIKMEEYSGLSEVDAASVTVTGTDITVSGQTSQMTATVLPANTTYPDVSWVVDNESVAVISESGLLTPVSNGTVTVTATNIENPDVSGSITITVSNQTTSFYIAGSATETGADVAGALPMHMVTGLNGTVTNIFEIYTSLTITGSFQFYSEQNTGALVYGSDVAGEVILNGSPITSSVSGPVLITLNLNTNTYTITPINWSVVGSTIQNGWSGDEPLTYQGGGIWSAQVAMDVVTSDLNPRFVFKGNQSWSYVIKKIPDTHHVVMESQATTYGTPVQDIDLGYGDFMVTLNLADYTYSVSCVSIDDYKISFMGSSVMNGQGATNMQGYAYMYNQLLADRAATGSSPFYRSNISINGNNTLNVLGRYEKDLIADCGNYVIFGLALGNEGIHENGQPAYDQYLANMQLLIQKAINDGKTPVVMSNYSREDFTLTDYAYVKQMNIMMAQWNVPSTNLLGAIDNGTGNWVPAYQDDLWHPNTAGHQEFFYAMVPSLFDALEAGKTTPLMHTDTYISPSTDGTSYLTFTPENTIHPFTFVIDVKTGETGQIFAFTNTTNTGTVAIDANGHLVYTSPSGATITGTTVVNDNTWHTITLTHYYARGETLLYADATAEGSVAENLTAQTFTLHGTNAPQHIDYRNWFFYRSGMNASEITEINNDVLLQSSLELYAPLDMTDVLGDDPYLNLAQSTNTINSDNFALGLSSIRLDKKLRVYPNPVNNVLHIWGSADVNVTSVAVYTILGAKLSDTNTSEVNMSQFTKGIYVIKVNTSLGFYTFKVVKE